MYGLGLPVLSRDISRALSCGWYWYNPKPQLLATRLPEPAALASSFPSPPVSLILCHIHTARLMEKRSRPTICKLIRAILHLLFFPLYHSNKPNKYSTIARSSINSGDQAKAKSLRVACSCPSNRKRSIVEVIADMTAVIAELHKNPSAARTRDDSVG